LVEAKALLATIAQRYRVRLVPGHVVEPIGRVTLRARNGVQVTLEPRARRQESRASSDASSS
jgi:hypothetical protein